ncbi:MAG: tetratricopeptide repeat protein [Kiritimatiellia bacterium]
MKPLPSILTASLFLLLSACGRNPETLARRGIEALNEESYGQARHLLEKAGEKTGGERSADLWALAGLAAARSGRAGDAERLFMQALEIHPPHFEANYNLGELLIQQDRLEEAALWLNKEVFADTGRTEALEALAGIALRQQEFDAALEYLQQARTRGENARVLTSLAVAGKIKFSVEQSRDLLQQAVTMDPGYAPAQLNLAALLDQNRLDPAQAANHYEAFLRLRPEDDKVPLVRQRLQIMLQREASGDFSRPDPLRQQVEALLDQATRAAQAGNKALALQSCLQANALATRAQRTDLRERALRAAPSLIPDSARSHLGLGQFLLSQNRKTEAMISLERARELAPEWQMSLRPAVLLAADLGRKTSGTAMLRAAEQAGADNPGLLMEVGDLYAEALNDERESRRVYREILEKFPDYNQRAALEARLNR